MADARAIQRAILRLEREQARAFNRRDVSGAMRVFSPRFVGFSSTTHARIRGLGAQRKTFQFYLRQSPKMTYRIEQPLVQVTGDTAVATFYWSVGLGRGHVIHGRGTHVFVRQGKNWRVVHEHFSRAH
ncbi:MAG TPA: nuclear transport factor 2 family protein [Terriglobales bacterium]|nr:nuclear transport factor 2 family protein [Terriglobales bacterium]